MNNTTNNPNKEYRIYIRSDEHPRTINSYQNSRCYYTLFVVKGRQALEEKVTELRANGEVITDIRTNLGVRIYI